MQSTASLPGSKLAGEPGLPRPAPLRERLSKSARHNWPVLVLLSPLLAYIALVFAAPMMYQIAFAFYTRILYKEILWLPKPAFQFGNFIEAFSSAKYRFSMVWTIGVAFGTTAISIVLALPVAYFLARAKVWGRNLIEISFLLPIFGEVFTIYALAYALGTQGPVNWLLMGLHIIKEPLVFIGSKPFVLFWMSLPTLSVLLIRSAFSGVDVVYEEAAQAMGAGFLDTFFKVSIPLAKNGIMGAFLLGMSGAVGAYNLPLIMVGPYNDWLANWINKEISPYFNYPMASALGLILTVMCLTILYLYMRNQREA
jgi:ABC-type spermidine/putrescine transport system permease subunit I